MGDYHDLYLKTDVLLLADVFEVFREMSIETYSLDPAHYFSLPGLSWDALLKLTGIKLELLTDINMHLFIKKGIRGGISMVSKRHAKANNEDCPDYDRGKPKKFIQYLDANNLYGWSMSQRLLVGGLAWATPTIDEVIQTSDNSDDGYIIEVDLEYPKELHVLYNDYPLAPETMAI